MALNDRLREIRERADLTQSAVCERTGIGVSSLSDFENAKREPSLAQVQALAKCYRMALTDLLSDRPPVQEVVLWRERPDKAAADVEAHFLELCRQYRNLEVWCEAEAPVRLPFAGPAGDSPFTFGDAEALATEIRKLLSLGDRPARSLLAALEEECGLKIFHLSFDPTGTAACSRSTGFGAGVLLNASNVRWRRNFDLAHELFHLLTWERFDHAGAASSKTEEQLADAFASHLLLPADALRTAIHQRRRGDSVSVEALFEIARDFDVSVDALLWRMKGIYGGTKEETERAIERAKRYARAYEERQADERPVRPARFHALAVKALRKGNISLGRFAEYLGISRRDALEYVENGDGSDEAFDLPSA